MLDFPDGSAFEGSGPGPGVQGRRYRHTLQGQDGWMVYNSVAVSIINFVCGYIGP